MKLHDWQALQRQASNAVSDATPQSDTVYCAECRLRFDDVEALIRHTMRDEAHRKAMRRRLKAVAT